jgi:DHA2 family multidrug resistance protein-like MFS transporter
MSTSTTAPRAGRREWIGLTVVALPTLLLSIDLTVLNLALPKLSAALHPSTVQTLWIMDIYGFMVAGFLVTMGTLGDRIGRRRLLVIGASVFALASAVAAYSTSPGMLIAMRAVMGIAGSTLVPSTLALISNMFQDPKQRGLAVAVWMSCFLSGAAFGPVVAGVLLQWFWWGSVFLLGVPVMALLLVTAPALLPDFRDTSQPARPDLVSVALFLLTILPIIYGLKSLARDGWGTVQVAAVVVGVVFGVLFGRRQRRLASPLLDISLFGNRGFSTALTLLLLVGAIQGGSLLLVNLYLQTVQHLSPLAAGLWLMPSALAMIASNLVAPQIARRITPQNAIAAGLLITAVGYVLLSRLSGAGGLALLVVGFTIVMIGVGPLTALGYNIVLGAAPPAKAGSAAAMSSTAGELGIALGIASLGSLGSAVYRGRLDGHIPAGTSSGAAQSARESIVDAVTAAARLPAPIGHQLLTTARSAFATGLDVVAGLGAALFVVLAVLTVAVLRNVRPAAHDQPGDQSAEPSDIGQDPIPAG